MSTKGNLNRKQAVAIIGEDVVSSAEGENCEPTGRVGYNGACQGDELTEWSASADGVDKDGTECSVRIYYYTTESDAKLAEETGDWGSVNWKIAGYEVA